MKALLVVVALSAVQSTGPEHGGYDPTAERLSASDYEGEMGDKLRAIEGDIRCSCGCGLDLHSCQFAMQCDTSPSWSRRIRDALDRGEDAATIRAAFVADFGPAVLMAPPATGFNWVGYLLPMAAILLAGGLVGRSLRGSPAPSTAPAGALATPLSEADEERIARELRRVEEMERPDW